MRVEIVEKGHTHQECHRQTTCFFCKAKRHRQYDCPEVKKKEAKGTQPVQFQQAVAAVAEETETPAAETVATIRDSGSTIDQDDARVTVVEIAGKKCKLSALIDTGSPVSLFAI